MSKVQVMSKRQMLAELGMSSYTALKRIVERSGVTWVKGPQLFTPVEISKVFGHYDHTPGN